MLSTIERLASAIDDAWSQAGYADEAFGELAADALARPLDVDFSTVAHAVCEGIDLPDQRRTDQGFGQPALTLHYGDRFLIEALCWHSGTPAIHQHAFSGAFRVMTGRSVHTRYSFVESDRVGPITLGELRLECVEMLDAHSTVVIPRGGDLIHAAFHLDSPSMTIVARTPQGPEPEPTYLPPGVAYDSAARSPGLHKRLQILDTLNATAHASYGACVHCAIDHADLYDGMAIVMRAASHRVDEPTFLKFTEHLGVRHGPRIAPLLRALVEERRRTTIVRMRASVTDEESRFFLAVLMSFSRRDDLLQAFARRYGDAKTARDHVIRGVADLVGGDGDRHIVTSAAADAMLDGVPARSFPARAARLWKRTMTAEEDAKLIRYFEQLVAHPLLTPLLNGAGP